jgi:hypothetical protein
MWCTGKKWGQVTAEEAEKSREITDRDFSANLCVFYVWNSYRMKDFAELLDTADSRGVCMWVIFYGVSGRGYGKPECRFIEPLDQCGS